MMGDLHLYFVVFAWQNDSFGRDWHAAAGYIFASNQDRIESLLTEKYDKVSIKSIRPVDIPEGTVLYGSRRHSL